MAWIDTAITVIAVAGFFLLIYSAIRKQNIVDTFQELKEIFSETLAEKPKEVLRYA